MSLVKISDSLVRMFLRFYYIHIGHIKITHCLAFSMQHIQSRFWGPKICYCRSKANVVQPFTFSDCQVLIEGYHFISHNF
jgi:hypothetical protein